MTETEVYLALGSNLGDRLMAINSAVTLLSEKVHNLKLSKVYETKPWGITDQPDFLNACVSGQTKLSPTALLKFVKSIEQQLGRQHRTKWGPREIDIDILFYGSEVTQKDNLKIPHPFLAERIFVLEPLNDLKPDLVHPLTNKTISALLAELELKTQPSS